MRRTLRLASEISGGVGGVRLVTACQRSWRHQHRIQHPTASFLTLVASSLHEYFLGTGIIGGYKVLKYEEGKKKEKKEDDNESQKDGSVPIHKTSIPTQKRPLLCTENSAGYIITTTTKQRNKKEM